MVSVDRSQAQELSPAVTVTGTAKGVVGPSLGLVDIGISKSAYMFRVALPGVRSNGGNLKCDIKTDGRVHIQGEIMENQLLRTSSKVFNIKLQQLCSPGPFSVSFNLPGPVEPRLCSLCLKNGVLEAVVLKLRIPCVSSEGQFENWHDVCIPSS